MIPALLTKYSTGGIIALGLTARNWSVEECTHQFEDLCRQVFTKRIGSNLPGVSWLVENFHHSRYETRPLQKALMNAFQNPELLFGGTRSHSPGNPIKVAITATSHAGQPAVFANYNRPCTRKCAWSINYFRLKLTWSVLYHFQRPDKAPLELKTWEAYASPNYHLQLVNSSLAPGQRLPLPDYSNPFTTGHQTKHSWTVPYITIIPYRLLTKSENSYGRQSSIRTCLYPSERPITELAILL